MDAIQTVERAHCRGRYIEALHAVQTLRIPSSAALEADVWRVDIFERVGMYDESQAVAARLLGGSHLSWKHRAICEAARGRIAADTGATTAAVAHFQAATSACEKARDNALMCWVQLRMVAVLAESSGQQAAATVLGELRQNAVRLGDPIVSAALHVYVAQMEGKRGRVANAVKHTLLAQQLLGGEENVWLEGMAETTLTASAIISSEYERALQHGTRALKLAEISGAAVLRRSALNNLGNVYYQLGNFPAAVEIFERCQESRPSIGTSKNGVWDCLGQLRLLQDRLSDAAHYLGQIKVRAQDDWRLYPNRHSKLTIAVLLSRQERFIEALECCESATQLALQTDDRTLQTLATLTRSNILQSAGRVQESHAVLTEMSPFVTDISPYAYAEYERTIGSALMRSGFCATGNRHLQRARHFYKALHSVPGTMQVDRTLTETSNARKDDGSAPPLTTGSAHDTSGLLQHIASLLLQPRQPEILATGIVAILADTRCAVGAIAVARSGDEAAEVLSSFGQIDDGAEHRTLKIGTLGSRTFEVVLQPLPDVESRVTLNALATLLGTIRELETARTEREDRLTLWPADELTDNEDGAAATGTMGMVMATVRRVAPVNVLVLITGESGTGKEVLARSIHRASPRAAKPFVPFNCAAVPRELLESQLFGHRRGAFTGAERDSPGVIRAARDGTLFLDEIGELGLDLQPKLLRFLESSEINPLGESTPFRVDVRIVAATNANLDDLVHQGKFREDLFYRLNVIRLSIPPLRERREEIPALVHHFIARAATEFNKGRMRIAEEAMEHLLLFRWPGNVRQLQNEIRRMVALADPDSVLRPSMIDPLILRATPKASPPPETPDMAVSLHDNLPATITRIEREMIERALKAHDGKVDAVARALGISRKGLYLKRQRLGL
jgi:DNA-binding NtrC family response regulator